MSSASLVAPLFHLFSIFVLGSNGGCRYVGMCGRVFESIVDEVLRVSTRVACKCFGCETTAEGQHGSGLGKRRHSRERIKTAALDVWASERQTAKDATERDRRDGAGRRSLGC